MTAIKEHEQRLVWNRNRNKLKMISIDKDYVMEFSKAMKRELVPGQELLIWNYGGWIMICPRKYPSGYVEYNGWIHRKIEVVNLHFRVDMGMAGEQMFTPGVYKESGEVMNIMGVDWLVFGPLDSKLPISIPEDYKAFATVSNCYDMDNMCFDIRSAIQCGLMDCKNVVFGEDDNGSICFTPISRFEVKSDNESFRKSFVKPHLSQVGDEVRVSIFGVNRFGLGPGRYDLIFGNFEDGRPWIRFERNDLDL